MASPEGAVLVEVLSRELRTFDAALTSGSTPWRATERKSSILDLSKADEEVPLAATLARLRRARARAHGPGAAAGVDAAVQCGPSEAGRQREVDVAAVSRLRDGRPDARGLTPEADTTGGLESQDLARGQWVCKSCAFVNDADDVSCAVCSGAPEAGGRRPPPHGGVRGKQNASIPRADPWSYAAYLSEQTGQPVSLSVSSIRARPGVSPDWWTPFDDEES